MLGHKGVRHLCDVRCLTPGEALPHVEEDLAAVARRTHGEVNPPRGATPLVDELVKFPTSPISDIQQDT